jgi:hypothetical protein
MMSQLGQWVYIACVDFMLRSAHLFGMTYRDTNGFMFFILWPAVTLALAVVNVWQSRRLRALRRARTLRDDRDRRD